MRVVLTQDIRGIGKKGDIKNVSDGYARNFLIPQKRGTPATQTAIEQSNRQKHLVELQINRAHEETKSILESIARTPLVITSKANQEGTLFSGITAETIANHLSKILSKPIKKEWIMLDKHIKKIGEHDIKITINGSSMIVQCIVNRN